MHELLWLPVLLLLILSLTLIRSASTRQGSRKLPPGPPKLPVLGNLHQLSSPLHRCLWKLAKKHGPLMYLQLGNVPVIVISSARLAQEALKSHDLELCSRPKMVSHRKFSYNLLDVAFAPYGDYWRGMRKMTILELLSPKRVQSVRCVREEEVGLMIEVIAKASGPVNLSEALHHLSNNVTCRAALGRSYEDEHGAASFRAVMAEAQASFVTLFAEDYLPFGAWIDLITGKKKWLQTTFTEVDAIFERVIEDHLQPNRPKLEQEDFIDVLLKSQHHLGLTRDHIKAVLMGCTYGLVVVLPFFLFLQNVFFAGTDTTSSAVIWAMTELMRNPGAMRRVQEELSAKAESKKRIEERELHHFEYLDCVVKETLRLHPPAPLLVPHESCQVCTIDGYKIEEGTRVYINVFSIGRDPGSWERAEEFMPERFCSSSIEFKGRDFQFIPFGAGKRMCPGLLSGIRLVQLALANLLHVFEWGLPNGLKLEDMDMDELPGITVNKKAPLVLVPLLRNNEQNPLSC